MIQNNLEMSRILKERYRYAIDVSGTKNLPIVSVVQVSYAIGLPEPLSVTVFDYGTGTKSSKELMQIVKNNFDLRPGRIVK